MISTPKGDEVPKVDIGIIEAAKDVAMAIKRSGISNKNEYRHIKFKAVWDMLQQPIAECMAATTLEDIESKANHIKREAVNAGILFDLIASATVAEYVQLEPNPTRR